MAKSPKLSQAAQQRRRDINTAKMRYKRQADRYRADAEKLPEDSRERKIFERAATALDERRSDLNGINIRKRFTKEQRELIRDSADYLVKNQNTDWKRGEVLGKLRLSGTNLGHRFYALTESLWAGVPYTGPGDDRRLNAVRKAVANNPEVVEKYGPKPNANELIEVVETLYAGDLEEEYTLGDSKQKTMMRGVRDVVKRYG